MHGLVNRSIQNFLTDAYGADLWRSVARAAECPPDGFEAMLQYDDALTYALLGHAAARLGKPKDVVLEDLGTYLVAHPGRERLRRLLRFGGTGFLEFLQSLDDLQGRGHIALPDLHLPALELDDRGGGRFGLTVSGAVPGMVPVLVGLLRAMADDYGALAFIAREGDETCIGIELLDIGHAEGRGFVLSGVAQS